MFPREADPWGPADTSLVITAALCSSLFAQPARRWAGAKGEQGAPPCGDLLYKPIE